MRRDAKAITQLIVDKNIEYTKATPSEYNSWLWVGTTTLREARNWKVAGVGGEVISRSLLDALKSLELAQLRVFSDYGPAEATLSSYRIELDYKSDSVTERVLLGLHLPIVSTYIVDQNRQLVPLGWLGEILIGGPGISSGYFKQPDLTAEKFIPDQFASINHAEHGWTTVFCSGDRGRVCEDGSLLFDGRISERTQVKLRGFRVELSDIEQSILDGADGLVTSAVITVRGQLDLKFLVGHLIFTPGISAEKRESLLRLLPRQLPVPSYMCPAMLFALEEMPMTSHDGHMEAIWTLWCSVLPREATMSIRPEKETDFISAGDPIDWESESRLNTDLINVIEQTGTRASNENGGVHVLVTGASGFISRHVLKQLNDMEEISRISCVAVRQKSFNLLLSESLSKVEVYKGDLTSPSLGLSAEHFKTLGQQADVILHRGSDRSFWNPYRLLRSTNEGSTKELLRLAALRKTPVIFISSGAVENIHSVSDLSQADVTGYLASKYINEILLKEAQKTLQVPVTIIRMLDGATKNDNAGHNPVSRSEVTDAICRMGTKLGKRFQHEDLSGSSMSFARVADLSNFICSEVQRLHRENHGSGEIRYHYHANSACLNGEGWCTLFGFEGSALYQEWRKLPVIPVTTWFGEAKKHGFEYLISSQVIKLNDIVSQR
ncbi:hypothetical protein UA08_02205 [Talaromyces atroroseus]|uniref:AMP-dependent synthetase/ligase domain-containing protein n=1 Tax=Talaromyces atroroseus TaxID=1441469 RepID=A0A225AL24_TALAT|nr:hypothetical protein UA08_02205 [Talaromyces atroroseus]OKL62242.1 hypothetical protein UA08_02205 [Talaromyces atroroseus]